MTSLCEVMRISHARQGREVYKESMTGPWSCCVTVVWVFWYNAFGIVNKPQTLYLHCISAPHGGSITRINLSTCLSICMHPEFAGGL